MHPAPSSSPARLVAGAADLSISVAACRFQANNNETKQIISFGDWQDASSVDASGKYRRFGIAAPANACPPKSGFVCVFCNEKGFAGRAELTVHHAEECEKPIPDAYKARCARAVHPRE